MFIVSTLYLVKLMSLELNVLVYPSFVCSGSTWFKINAAVYTKFCWLFCLSYMPSLAIVWLCSTYFCGKGWKIKLFPKLVWRRFHENVFPMSWIYYYADFLLLLHCLKIREVMQTVIQNKTQFGQTTLAFFLIDNKWGNHQSVDNTVKIDQS